MSLKITQVTEARVKVIVEKTGKTYWRTMNYAKHVITGEVKGTKQHDYYLRKDNNWIKVSEAEFKEGTSKEAEQKIHEKLSQELRKRVEEEMRVEVEMKNQP